MNEPSIKKIDNIKKNEDFNEDYIKKELRLE